MATKPLSEQLRDAIERSGKTRYRISMETGIAQSVLSRFVNDPSVGLSMANVERLCESLGVELVVRKRSAEKLKR